MVRVFLFFMLALFSIQGQAQQSSQWFSAAQAAGATYSFRCVTDGRTTGDSCDICPSTIVESRSFNGLLVLRGSTPWRWIDQPYSIRVKPGNVVEYWEHGVSPYNERLTIALSQTPFTTVQAMADSTFCNASTPGSYALFTASDSINNAPIFRGDTLTIVGRNLAQVSFDSLLNKYVINVDSIAGGGGGGSLWTDAGAYTYLTSTTDRAVVGSATELNTSYILQANGGFFAKGAGATSGTFSAQFHNSSGTNNAFVIRNDGKIGVGLTTPNGRFQIQGFGTTSATNAFEIRNSASDPTLYVNDEGSSNFGQNTTTFSTDHPFFPIQMNGGVINFQNNAVDMFSATGGFSGEISTLGTGLWGNVRGVNFIVKSKNSHVSSTYAGGYFSARIGSAGGRAGSLIGVRADAFTDDATGGTVGTISAYIAENWGVTNAGVTGTNAYGLRVNPILNTGTITNTFGIDIGDITAGTQTNQAYSIRTTDANARQGFSGSSQFGGTGVPARTLHVVGEARISDLTTDTPTGIVGADADGDLSLLGLSGISIVGGVLTVAPGSGASTGNATTVTAGVVDWGGATTQNTVVTGNGTHTVHWGALGGIQFDSKNYLLLQNSRRLMHESGAHTAFGSDTLFNFFAGYLAGQSFGTSSTGYANTAIGTKAGTSLNGTAPNASSNTLIGSGSGELVTTGSFNTVVGTRAAGLASTTLTGLTAMGHHAGLNNTGNDNVMIGRSAGEGVTSGLVVAIGGFAGYVNTTGSQNTYIGNGAGRNNIVGAQNTFVGHEAGFNSATAAGDGENTFMGYRSGLNNSTGTLNTFIGKQAGQANTTGVSNTYVGRTSGILSTGSDNAFFGLNGGSANTSGSRNTYLGRGAGSSGIATGSDNILLGYNVNPATDVSNVMMLGNAIYTTTQNNITTSAVGIGTITPARKLHVQGEARITDLTTDAPTGIVGADADGDLGLLGLSGLSIVSGVLTATPGGTNYQTWRDDGVAAFARPNANFVSTSTIAMALSDDAGNTETEVTANVITNSITNALIRQGVAKSVIGVSGNATANVADIAASAADQVLVVNGANTALAFGTVATGGITNSAVTYAKIQNAAANNVLLGNNNGAGTAYEEINMAALQTMAGYVDGTGVAGRHAYWTDANTLANDADNLWDATNNRMSILNTAPGVGSNNAALNIQVGAQTGPQEMIRMSGNVNGNMIMPLTNASTFAGSNTFNQVIVGGDAAGDPFTQYTVTGFATTSVGIDNSDGNKFKISPNVSTPGFNVNNGIILTNDAVCDVGINKDAPIHPLDVGGVTRAVQFRNTGNEWNNSDIVFGTGAGTGPTIGSISGGNNGWQINFNTGTSPVLDGIIFTATFPNPFGSLTYSSMEGRGVPGGINFNNERVKFVLSSENATTLVLRANGTLTASTQYAINFITFGY
jgi:hypothetical protein